MKKNIIFLCIVMIAASLAGCSPYKTGVEYPDFPDCDVELYDDAIVFEYDGDDEENEITYGITDDVEDVMEFYQELFEDEDYVILDEEADDDDEYKVEGYIDDIYFEIEAEEADGDAEKYFDTTVNIKTEEMDDDDSRYLDEVEVEIIIEEADEPIEEESIVIFQNQTYIQDQLFEFAALYTQETGVKVEIITIEGYSSEYESALNAHLLSGSQVDIFIVNTMAQYNTFADRIAPFGREEWMNETNLELVVDGETCGFPVSAEAWGIAYNAEILKQAGVDPASLTNIDAYREAFAAIDAMKDELGIDSVIAMAAGRDMTWVTGLHNFNGYLSAGLEYGDTTIVDQLNDGQADMERLAEYADWVELLFMYADPAVLTTGNYEAQVGQFANEKSAFIHQGNWIDPWLNSNRVDFEMGFAPHCSVAGEHNAIFIGAPSYYVLNNESENLEAAKAFLNYMAMNENGHNYMVNEAKIIPAFTNVTIAQDLPLAASVAEWLQVEDGAYTWLQNELPTGFGMGTLGPIYEAYAKGNITKEEFIDMMADAIESIR